MAMFLVIHTSPTFLLTFKIEVFLQVKMAPPQTTHEMMSNKIRQLLKWNEFPLQKISFLGFSLAVSFQTSGPWLLEASTRWPVSSVFANGDVWWCFDGPLISRWWFQTFVIFIPTCGKDSHFDYMIFFKGGWFNHQLYRYGYQTWWWLEDVPNCSFQNMFILSFWGSYWVNWWFGVLGSMKMKGIDT